MDLSKLIDQYADKNTLGDLDAGETQVFVDLLILTILIDGEITEDELEGLATQWSQLPFAGDAHLEDLVGEQGFETRQWLEDNIHDKGAIADFITERAAKLERDEVKLAALRMIAVVALSDGVDGAEENLAHQFGRELGYTEEEVSDIIADVLDADTSLEEDS